MDCFMEKRNYLSVGGAFLAASVAAGKHGPEPGNPAGLTAAGISPAGSAVLTADFYSSVLFSLGRIALGFFLALLLGTGLAWLSARFSPAGKLLAPFMLTVKSVPVASFIILALIWFSSRNLSVLISFLMVLPVVYTNVLEGIRCLDPAMTEMARVFLHPGFKADPVRLPASDFFPISRRQPA